MSKLKEIQRLAEEYGFSQAGMFAPADMVFSPEFRQCCEDNVCGNYGANYSCPPACGTVEEMKEKTSRYTQGLLLKTEMEVDDAFDDKATKPIKKDHSQRSRLFFGELEKQGLIQHGLMMLAGPCSLCDKCLMPSGLPCRFPDKQASCLSAYCINIGKLADTANVSISWEGNQVSFFSVYLWNE